jgi:hypothetical protein
LYAASPQLRRALAEWLACAREGKKNKDSHIKVASTRGADKTKPTKGTYPQFDDRFYLLKRRFLDARDLAERNVRGNVPVSAGIP